MFHKDAPRVTRYALCCTWYEDKIKDARASSIWVGTDKADSLLLFGRVTAQRPIRSVTIWTASQTQPFKLSRSYEDPELAEHWMTPQGEWEATGAQGVLALKAMQDHECATEGVILLEGRKWLNAQDVVLRALGFAGTIQDGSVPVAVGGPFDVRPGGPRA